MPGSCALIIFSQPQAQSMHVCCDSCMLWELNTVHVGIGMQPVSTKPHDSLVLGAAATMLHSLSTCCSRRLHEQAALLAQSHLLASAHGGTALHRKYKAAVTRNASQLQPALTSSTSPSAGSYSSGIAFTKLSPCDAGPGKPGTCDSLGSSHA